MAVDSGNLNRIAQTQSIELVDIGINSAHMVALVYRQAHRLLAPQEHSGNIHIRSGNTGFNVCDHNDHIRRFNSDFCLTAHEFQHFAVGIGFDTAGVNDLELTTVPIATAVNAVTGYAGSVLHDGGTLTGQFIKKHGLSHIGTSYDGYQRFCHTNHSFQRLILS